MTKTQTRGICQCCGRDQAVVGARMSKHGYTVENGWFDGVCSGQRFAPLNVERAEADRTVALVRAQVVQLLQRADDLAAGRVFPKTADTGRFVRDARGRSVVESVPFDDADDYHRAQAVRTSTWAAQQRAKAGAAFADDLAALADRVHGTELRTVVLAAAPAPIEAGEQRRTESGRVFTSRGQDGARVRYSFSNGDGKTFPASMGVQAWRRMTQVAA